MSKFGKGLVNDIKEEHAFLEEQDRLKEKYHVKEKNVVVVEKTHLWKFTVKVIGNLIRYAATIIILILAGIGLFTLTYPEIRSPFLEILGYTIEQIISFF